MPMLSQSNFHGSQPMPNPNISYVFNTHVHVCSQIGLILVACANNINKTYDEISWPVVRIIS